MVGPLSFARPLGRWAHRWAFGVAVVGSLCAQHKARAQSAPAPAEAGPTDTGLLAQLPPQVRWAVAFDAPAVLAHGWQAFVRAHQQRALAERVEQSAAAFRRRFAVDPLRAEDHAQAGLNAASGLLVFALRDGGPSVAVARIAEPKAAERFAQSVSGAKGEGLCIGEMRLHGGNEPHTGAYAIGETLLWWAPVGAGAELRAALEARRKGPRVTSYWGRTPRPAALHRAGRGQLDVYVALPGLPPCGDQIAQRVGLSVGAEGIDVAGHGLGSLSLGCPLAHDAAGIAAPTWPAALDPFATMEAKSAQQALLWALPWAEWGAAMWRAVRPSDGPAPWAEAEQRLRTLWARDEAIWQRIDGPVHAAVGGAPSAPQTLARLATPAPDALAQWAQSACRSRSDACRRERHAGAPWRLWRPADRASAWQAAWAGRWAVVGNAPGPMDALLAQLTRTPSGQSRFVPPAPQTDPSPPLLRAHLDLAALSEHSRADALQQARAQSLLGVLPLTEWMLMGPGGDTLRELAAFGAIDLSVWREQGAIVWHARQRRPLTRPSP